MSRPFHDRLGDGWSSRLGWAALTAALLAAAIPSPAGAAPAGRAAQLERTLGGGAQVAVHRETGTVRFVGTAPGRPLARPAGVAAGAGPSATARAFLDAYGSYFGLRDAARGLDVQRVVAGPRGGSSVRFAQMHAGLPVLGGELIVNLDRGGRVLSAGGEAVPSRELASLDVDPSISAAAAGRAARAAIARAQGVDPAALDVAPAELEIYDSRLLGGPGLDRPVLVWRTEVTGGDAEDIRELVLVDAQLGSVALHFDQIAHAMNRTVCDGGNDPRGTGFPCTSPVRSEGGAATGIADVDLAYDFSGDTYDFFFDRFGRDSLDGRGLPLRSTVRYCDPAEDCPYENAFWNGEQMVYGDGYARADDVVGHELAHGVTDFTSHLFYYYQSGAINESLSDVFGELIDLTNGAGTDTPAVRWEMGEDIPVIGAIRDMANPPAFGDPDRMTSPNYTADPTESDGGGVHSNSGVNNKAAYLMTDGDTFNGRTVVGLGIDKVAQIYYTAATTMLTSGSDYADLAAGLQQACANLAGAGTAGIVAADCSQVAAAVAAVEMAQQPPVAPAPKALVCSPGIPVVSAYLDDFENPFAGRWAAAGLVGRSEWYFSQTDPYGFDSTYARSGTGNLWGYDREGLGDYAIAMTGDVTVPSGAFLHFFHAFGFEDDSGGAYDGGVLEYSVNGGVLWSDAAPLMVENGYTGTVALGFGNPLSGRSAFVRESNGYRSTRLDLSALAGQRVRFRFRIGTDNFLGTDDFGWFVDDVRIYTCGTPAASPPQTPPPPPPPAVTPPPAPRASASFAGRRRVTARRGRVRIALRCEADGVGACQGTLLLGRRGAFGRARFSLADGSRGTIAVRLSRKARRALARRGRLRTTLLVRTRVSGGTGGTVRVTLTIVLPRR
jgi:bacillolysin